MQLGVEGFSFRDLYDPTALARLDATFLAALDRQHPTIGPAYRSYRQQLGAGVAHGGLAPTVESALLISVAQAFSRFVLELFGITAEREAQAQAFRSELELFEFKRDFVSRRVFKKGAVDRPTREELPGLDARVAALLRVGFGAQESTGDFERALALAVTTLMRAERAAAGAEPKDLTAVDAAAKALAALEHDADARTVLGAALTGEPLDRLRALLAIVDRWTWARASYTHSFDGFWTIRQPKPLKFDALVELERPDPALPEAVEGPAHAQRRRDGFGLTDPRATPRQIASELDTCVLCHEREKDSCRHGFKDKQPQAAHTYKPNPLGVPLTGCPLDERISEMHQLKALGDSVGALAMIMESNPMCPGTGHRICNDCMRSCIFQKQTPVNIPQIETSVLTDVLALPYGFEVYGLLTRWNPLNAKRPVALPANGKNVLVVGLGPAGYTLSHYLLNEGFTVVAVDGLKLEPFDAALVGPGMEPIRDWARVAGRLDERVLEGFGGVSEYGITVRWDKSFLTLLHLTLLRRQGFRAYGGVRFGGTITLDDAWRLGFDHVAIAAGAGKPTLPRMKHNLVRGVRAASDFLMGLQLSGAFKRDSLSNLEVHLPAVVIGGGLTAIDTATELLAYYPVQVEKVLARHEALQANGAEGEVLTSLRDDQRATYATFLEHGRAVRAERARAAAAGEAPNLSRLVRQWGGVSVCYRRGLTESPAYRLNAEEVEKAFEEGLRFVERVSPVETVVDPNGAVEGLVFERMRVDGGKLVSSGERLTLPARTVCLAAGTSPNVTYEKEYPGTFALDDDGAFFRAHALVAGAAGGFELTPVEGHDDLGRSAGFFTSYAQGGRYVTFYGDNHPTYAGNVVKAMASARDGFGEVVRLFEGELRGLDDAGRAEREAKRAALFGRLDAAFLATVRAVNRLTPTIVEIVLHAPAAAEHFAPGQFFRLQNYERTAEVIAGTKLVMEGLALTGAWVDRAQGLVSTIVLEMGGSSRLCARLKEGEPVVLMGPTGAPTEIPRGETVLLAGGGLGNAVLFSIGQALRAAGSRVLYFAGYRRAEDLYMIEEVEKSADAVVWSVDAGVPPAPRRPQDRSIVGNIVQAMVAYAEGSLGTQPVPMRDVDRIIAIGSDRMMRAVKEARHGVLKGELKPAHCAVGSINSPMQCMMKEICAQCLQRHVDPRTGKESFVFSCFNQDQALDEVDFEHLAQRLGANAVLERQTDVFLRRVLKAV